MQGVAVKPLQSISRSRIAALSLSTILMLALGACDKKPGGQVVATVNSQEITQQELRTEAAANNVPANNFQDASAALLERLIQRNLLAEYARAQGMDRSPDFVARRRLLEQSLLSSLALKKIIGTPDKPTPAQVKAFMANNPSMFAQRERLDLDQLRFPALGDPANTKTLMTLGSLESIEAKLKADGVQVARGKTPLDTATLDPAVARQIVSFPPGKPFDITVGGTTYVSVVIGRAPIAADPTTWERNAADILQRKGAEQAVTTMVEKLRKDAKIEYDPAFAPKIGPKTK
jgi:EpsD family peptidyl-prolyl cis-trans isomerase